MTLYGRRTDDIAHLFNSPLQNLLSSREVPIFERDASRRPRNDALSLRKERLLLESMLQFYDAFPRGFDLAPDSCITFPSFCVGCAKLRRPLTHLEDRQHWLRCRRSPNVLARQRGLYGQSRRHSRLADSRRDPALAGAAWYRSGRYCWSEDTSCDGVHPFGKFPAFTKGFVGRSSASKCTCHCFQSIKNRRPAGAAEAPDGFARIPGSIRTSTAIVDIHSCFSCSTSTFANSSARAQPRTDTIACIVHVQWADNRARRKRRRVSIIHGTLREPVRIRIKSLYRWNTFWLKSIRILLSFTPSSATGATCLPENEIRHHVRNLAVRRMEREQYSAA